MHGDGPWIKQISSGSDFASFLESVPTSLLQCNLTLMQIDSALGNRPNPVALLLQAFKRCRGFLRKMSTRPSIPSCLPRFASNLCPVLCHEDHAISAIIWMWALSPPKACSLLFLQLWMPSSILSLSSFLFFLSSLSYRMPFTYWPFSTGEVSAPPSHIYPGWLNSELSIHSNLSALKLQVSI